MTAQAFIQAVEALDGLTPAMKQSLVELADKMTEEDRTESLGKLKHASEQVVQSLVEEAEIYDEGEKVLHQALKQMTKDSEGAERSTESGAADDLLSSM